MKQSHHTTSRKDGSIIIYTLIMMVLMTIIGGIASVVYQQTDLISRKADLAKAYQYADGGASIIAHDLNRAFTANPSDPAKALLADRNFPYALDQKQSTDDMTCYVRTISAPFPNDQTVDGKIWLSNDTDSDTVRIEAEATVGGVTQSATIDLAMSYGAGAAIISTAQGDNSTSTDKGSAQNGNVSIDTNSANKTFVEGGILANGSVNHTDDFSIEEHQIAGNRYDTEDRLPNYTNPGSADQLFDFDRYVAVAQKMGTHYANVAEFQDALKKAPGGVLEGVVVVDIYKTASGKSVIPSAENNNGHGNNIDGVDSSNPGNSKQGKDTDPTIDDEAGNAVANAAANAAAIIADTTEGKSNNGHGNNVDGVDSSNPGNSKAGQDSDPTVDDEKGKKGKADRSRRGKKDKDDDKDDDKKDKDDDKDDDKKDKDDDKGGKFAVDWTDSNFPDGITIRGTLVLNFSDEWSADDKMKIEMPLNINPISDEQLLAIEPGNPDTYASGYPAKLLDNTKRASSHDITDLGYENFSATDDLPALMYRNAIADLHGDVNISGVVYSPVFAEIENHGDGQLQYFSGSIIVGGGIYYQNKKNATSIISYNPTALDRLATAGNKGKVFKVVNRQ